MANTSSNNILHKALQKLNLAIEKDKAKEYSPALELYGGTVEYLKSALHCKIPFLS